MLDRIRRERGSGTDFLDLKTGLGGIIEAEFLVQALQMREKIWEPNWQRATDSLHASGAFGDAEAARLKQAYRFLRRCETVLRRYENKAVSTVPNDANDQRKLAIWLGYDTCESFRSDYSSAREVIHTVYERHVISENRA
jgi:glutamate-ammonia-ligase adenylyltransferase